MAGYDFDRFRVPLERGLRGVDGILDRVLVNSDGALANAGRSIEVRAQERELEADLMRRLQDLGAAGVGGSHKAPAGDAQVINIASLNGSGEQAAQDERKAAMSRHPSSHLTG